MSFYDKLKFNSDGLIPAIIRERSTGRVLITAWMNRAALETARRVSLSCRNKELHGQKVAEAFAAELIHKPDSAPAWK